MIKRLRFTDRKVFGDVDSIKNALANIGGEIPGGGGNLAELISRVEALENPVSIKSFSISESTPSSPVEVGREITQLKFIWQIENFEYVTSAKIRNTSDNVDVHTVTSANSNATKTVSLSRNTPGTKAFQLQLVAGARNINSSSVNVEWRYPVFYGSSSKASGLTESEIKEFTKTLKSNASGTYSFSAVSNSYKWLFFPESFSPTSFKSGGFDVPMQSPVTITITNDYGVSITLKGYRVTAQTSGSLDLVVA